MMVIVERELCNYTSILNGNSQADAEDGRTARSGMVYVHHIFVSGVFDIHLGMAVLNQGTACTIVYLRTYFKRKGMLERSL